MPKWFSPAAVLCGLMFVVSPVLIARAPDESSMGMVYKIYYYHMPSAWMFLLAPLVCGFSSALFLARGREGDDRRAWAAAELTVLFGALTLITGPLWARRAWGTWWVWDARLTSSLVGWMIGWAYLILRRYGGPGSDKLAAGVALFGAVNVPFIYLSVNYWRTIHPPTTVVPRLPVEMGFPLWWCVFAFLLLFVLLMTMRLRLEETRSRLDGLYVALDE